MPAIETSAGSPQPQSTTPQPQPLQLQLHQMPKTSSALAVGAGWPVWAAHLLVVVACFALLCVSFAAYHRKQLRVAAAKRHRLAMRGRTKLRMMSSVSGCATFGSDGNGGHPNACGCPLRLSADMGVPFGGSLGGAGFAADSGKRKGGGMLMFDFRRQSGRGGPSAM
ncbi:hypothetical protein BOX15_Mlig016832g1 [Macrostomum lignano]|uniref:Uncharacterized protein n=1 Tax=Macrostomum lignano TaxID=282301 RepID=A0A267ETR7_9PLAT|nr:hypothetical protein BOX15_Mlig016832g1 [Macrostomum lignano]